MELIRSSAPNIKSNISFHSIYANRALKKSLEFASGNGALFQATTIAGLSLCARPVSIWMTPDTEKENRKIALVKSLSSTAVNFLITLLLSVPFAYAIRKIDKNPYRYLKNSTINNLKENEKNLTESKSYNFATQLFKLGIGVVIAAPKAIMTASGMPYIMDAVFNKNEPEKKNSNITSFKGCEGLADGVGKIIDKKGFQNFSKKYKDSNFPMHITAITDALTTGVFINQIKKSKKIEEDRKQVLINNAGISTGLSIICGYIIDKILDKPAEKFIKKYSAVNKDDPNLSKQILGIKIAKPIFILGATYYTMIPFVSTYLAERVHNKDK